MIEHKFLAVSKQYLDIGLKSIDIMIIAQIEEFERNNCKCYMTNKQFANILRESESTVKRSIQKLESLNVIKRHTAIVSGNGRANKQRILSLNKYDEWKGQIEPTKMEGSNINNGRVKNDQWKGQNDPIKDNIKDKEKDNITRKEKIQKVLSLFSFEDDIQEDINFGLLIPEEDISEEFYSFAFDEMQRIGDNVNFIVYDNKIESYINDNCAGTYYGEMINGGVTYGNM